MTFKAPLMMEQEDQGKQLIALRDHTTIFLSCRNAGLEHFIVMVYHIATVLLKLTVGDGV